MLPNTRGQRRQEGEVKRGGKCGEAMLGGEVGRGDTRRLAMPRINVKIKQGKARQK